jgi:hypothetical protein
MHQIETQTERRKSKDALQERATARERLGWGRNDRADRQDRVVEKEKLPV